MYTVFVYTIFYSFVLSLISILYLTSSQCTKYKTFVSSLSGDCTYWTQYTDTQGWDDSDQEPAEISCGERCKNDLQCDYGILIDYSSCTLPSRCFLMGGCTDPYTTTWTSCSDTIYPYQCITEWTNTTTSVPSKQPSISPTDTTSNPTTLAPTSTREPSMSPTEVTELVIEECKESYVSFSYDLTNDCTYLTEYTEDEGWDTTDQESAEISCAKQCKKTVECDYGIFIDYMYDSQTSKVCDLPTKCILMGNCSGGTYRDTVYSCDEIIYNYGCVMDFSDRNYGNSSTEDDWLSISDQVLWIIIISVVCVIIVGFACLKRYVRKQRRMEKAEEKGKRQEELQKQRQERAEIERIEREKREKDREEYQQRQLELAAYHATQTTEYDYDDCDDGYDHGYDVNSGFVGGGNNRNNEAERQKRMIERKQKDLERKQKAAEKKQTDAMKKQQRQQTDAAKKQTQQQNAQLKAQCKSRLKGLGRMNGQNMCPSCGHAFGSGKDNAARKNQHVRKCKKTHQCPCGKSFKNIKKYANHLRSH